MKNLLKWFMTTRFYLWFLSSVMPKFRFSTQYTTITGRQYHSGYALLQPGDLVCSADKKKASSIVPGDLSHCDVCVAKGPDVEHELVGMTSKNFTPIHFFDVCKESDQVVIFRPDFTPEYLLFFLSRIREMRDLKYDFSYDMLDPSKVFCTELPYHADAHSKIGWKIQKDLLGRDTIIPDSFYETKGLRVIWDSDKV